ncbi:MAG: radical SAM protein [Chloroflexi bacterium]|nr:radical SAM protein [Chloroflexota bacterium]
MVLVPPIVHEIEARSAINAVQGMPFKWSLNPYKGCRHACTYCYARAYHAYLDLPVSAFETQIFVKTNLPQVLQAELRRPSWRGEAIAVGTGTDPYQPIEGQYRITRQCLEALADAANPGSVSTKGTLVRRDVDVLSELSNRVGFSVNISLISLDRDLLQKLEPGAPVPAARLETIRTLSRAGIPVSVFLAPVIPGLTDAPSSLAEVVRAAADHGASDVWTGALRLPPGVREYFRDAVAVFPQVNASCDRLYAGRPTLPTSYQMRIEDEVSAVRAAEGLSGAKGHCPQPLARKAQLALPI